VRVKLPGREADYSPPSSAEVKNRWRYTSTSHTPSLNTRTIIIIIIIIITITIIAISKPFYGVERKSGVEIIKERVWIEIHVCNDFNLLLGNHYFSTNCNVKIIENDL
jgi:hypothetical protein